MTTRVSVITPAFNAGHTISEALFSAWNQTVRPDEAIVADDGSTDDTAQRAQEAGATVLRLPRGNGSIARNEAVKAADGEILFFLDADDVWEPTKIERHLEVHARSESSVVLDRARPFVDSGVAPTWIAGLPGYGALRWQDLLNHKAWPTGSGFSVRKRHYDAVGGFNEQLTKFQDVDFWIRCIAENGDGYQIGDVLTRYRLSPGSVSKSAVRTDENLLAMFERWPFASADDRAAMKRIAFLLAAEQSSWPEALRYLTKAGWPINRRFFWKSLLVSLKRTMTPTSI